jgi:hypothetical protein
MIGEMNEDVTGNGILRSRRAHNCFDVSDLEDCRNCGWLHQAKNCHDCYAWGFTAEESYRCMEVGAGSYHVLFSLMTYNGADVLYSWNCRLGCKNVFGCVSLKHNQYCILNKQYTKEEYEELVPKIIEHMRRTPLRSPNGSSAGQEWGEFFPFAVCPLAYNQTIAQDYFPLTKAQATMLGARWKDEEPMPQRQDLAVPPDSIEEVQDDVCGQTFRCESTGKPFKIIPQELRFLRERGIPLPAKSFTARHRNRFLQRNPRKLWNRACAKCQKPIATSYSPERPEIVYCEECFLKEVY